MTRLIVATLVASILATSAAAKIVKLPTHEQFLYCAAASKVLSMRAPSEFNLDSFYDKQFEFDLYVKASIIAGGHASGLSVEEFEIAVLRVHYGLSHYLQDYASWPDEMVDATRRMCAKNSYELAIELGKAFRPLQ